MRGLLLITVAVILIGLGLRQSDSDPNPTNTEAANSGEPEMVGEGMNLESHPSSLDSGPEGGGSLASGIAVPVAPELDPNPVGQSGSGADGFYDPGSNGSSEPERPFVLDGTGEEGELVAELGGERVERTGQGGEQVPAWTGSLESPNGEVSIKEASSGRFELGAPGGESGAVAIALLEAWISQSPKDLQDALDADHGSQVAQDQARLAGTFWQAMVGRPEAATEAWDALVASGSATPAQLEMLQSAINFDSELAVPEHAGRRDPLARSMRMVLLEAAAGRYQDSSKSGEAAVLLSELLLSEINAPWPAHRQALVGWAQRLNHAQNGHRLHPRGDWPALTYRVEPNESLELIRKRLVRENPGLLMCTGLIRKVNQVGRYIHPGDVLRIPTAPSNMLVDLDARMAFYRHGSEVVHAWTVGIGKEGKDTPVGSYTVGDKLEEPVWTRRGKQPLPFGHPENLLGTRWLGWYEDGVKTDYGFHGTNDASGVGGKVSSGCIRMRNEDVEALFELLPSGSLVVVQP